MDIGLKIMGLSLLIWVTGCGQFHKGKDKEKRFVATEPSKTETAVDYHGEIEIDVESSDGHDTLAGLLHLNPKAPDFEQKLQEELILEDETLLTTPRDGEGDPPYDGKRPWNCAPEETECVQNYNWRIIRENPGNMRAFRIVKPGFKNHSMASVSNRVRYTSNFFAEISRGRLVAPFSPVTGNFSPRQRLPIPHPNAGNFMNFFTMPRMGNRSSHGGQSRRLRIDDLQHRSFVHEAGHALTLGHANTLREPTSSWDAIKNRNWKIGTRRDYLSMMSALSGFKIFTAPQLHWLGWTDKEDIIKINHLLETKGRIIRTLRPTEHNSKKPGDHPLALVYELSPPNKGRKPTRLFMSLPRLREDVGSRGDLAFHLVHKDTSANPSPKWLGTLLARTIRVGHYDDPGSKVVKVLGLNIRVLCYKTTGSFIYRKKGKPPRQKRIYSEVTFEVALPGAEAGSPEEYAQACSEDQNLPRESGDAPTPAEPAPIPEPPLPEPTMTEPPSEPLPQPPSPAPAPQPEPELGPEPEPQPDPIKTSSCQDPWPDDSFVGVIVYDFPHCQEVREDGKISRGVRLSPRSYNMRQLKNWKVYNNWISSIRVAPGYKAKIYRGDYRTGGSRTVTGGVDLSGTLNNNAISSIVITKIPEP